MEQTSTKRQETSAVCTGTAQGCKRLALTVERAREALDYDPETGIFRWKINQKRARVGAVTGTAISRGYRLIKLDGVIHSAHRLAWLCVHGRWPDGVIDHINGDTLDNRIVNLRETSFRVNSQNQRKPMANNKVGLLGVRVRKNRTGLISFRASIVVDGKLRHLGTRRTPEEAHQLYLEAKRKLHPGCTI